MVDIEISNQGEYYQVFCKSEKAIDKVYNELKLAVGGKIVAFTLADAKNMKYQFIAMGLKVNFANEI